jgi:hypothetical protein
MERIGKRADAALSQQALALADVPVRPSLAL